MSNHIAPNKSPALMIGTPGVITEFEYAMCGDDTDRIVVIKWIINRKKGKSITNTNTGWSGDNPDKTDIFRSASDHHKK